MADLSSNDTFMVPAATHGTYSDNELSWPNRKADFIATLVPFMVLSWAAVALRLYTRLWIVRAPGWDDLFIGLALITGTMSGICLAIATNYGMGHHIFDVTPADQKVMLMLFYLANGSFMMSNAMVKISLLLQYLRTFADRRLRRLCITLTFITCAYALAFAFLAWFPCIPAQGFWRRDMDAFCYAFGSRDNEKVYVTVLLSNIFNMALDVAIFVLPIPLLFRKDTVRNTKLGLLALFGLGIIINIIAGLRLAANQVLAQERIADDLTYKFPLIFTLGEAENRLSVILASIPVFWPVVTNKIHEVFITRESSVRSTSKVSSERGRSWRDSDDKLARYKGRQGVCEDVELQAANGKHEIDYQEDEVLEAGVRHPGRLVDVESYTNALFRPFTETEDRRPNAVYEVRAETFKSASH